MILRRHVRTTPVEVIPGKTGANIILFVPVFRPCFLSVLHPFLSSPTPSLSLRTTKPITHRLQWASNSQKNTISDTVCAKEKIVYLPNSNLIASQDASHTMTEQANGAKTTGQSRFILILPLPTTKHGCWLYPFSIISLYFCKLFWKIWATSDCRIKDDGQKNSGSSTDSISPESYCNIDKRKNMDWSKIRRWCLQV